jgi:hypothetical protein
MPGKKYGKAAAKKMPKAVLAGFKKKAAKKKGK